MLHSKLWTPKFIEMSKKLHEQEGPKKQRAKLKTNTSEKAASSSVSFCTALASWRSQTKKKDQH
jgi:hypothetical protein